MRVATDKIRRLARRRGLTLSALLARAGVSRNAYYSLARRSSVLPKTLGSLARTLGVSESELLDEVPLSVVTARRICAENPAIAFENAWHVLAMLEMKPTERLNRSLIRGRATAVHR
jgi:transcriptional regulator with XRE-family HTH domain